MSIRHSGDAATMAVMVEREREMGAENEEWRKKADTHMMRPDEVEKAGVQASKRPPGKHPGEVLHQRRSFPFSKMGSVQLTLAGFLLAAALGYFTLYVKSKPEETASDVAKAAAGTRDSDRVFCEQK